MWRQTLGRKQLHPSVHSPKIDGDTKTMSKTKLINLDIPVGFLKEFDKEMEKRGYNSRAEAIRKAMRDLMEKKGEN